MVRAGFGGEGDFGFDDGDGVKVTRRSMRRISSRKGLRGRGMSYDLREGI